MHVRTRLKNKFACLEWKPKARQSLVIARFISVEFW